MSFSRRRLVALVSAGVIVTIGLIVAVVLLSLTRTDRGHEVIRRFLQAQLTAKTKGRGSIYIGHIGGGLIEGVTLDSLAIRDDEDSLVVSTGRISLSYDPRDLVDKRLLLHNVTVERPVVNLRRHADGVWNFRRIFPASRPSAIRAAERGFSDFIVIDTLTLHRGSLIVTMPWHPDDTLHGYKRDSAIAHALDSDSREVRRTAEGLKRTRRWTGIEAMSPELHLADPYAPGQRIVVGRLDARENDPPFHFTGVSGLVTRIADSLWFDATRWNLPGSTGNARGKVAWGPGPTHYDVQVHADSFSLADVAWVYPTLPTTGGGVGDLSIRNEPANVAVLDYALSGLDVRTEHSHLRGALTFAVGAPVLVVKDVAMRADPLDFDLIRTFNGKPFPVDWRGQIVGDIRARGGPLNRWQVDAASFAFHDANVPGAVTRGTASGGLDILQPAYTVFRGLDVNVATMDLRSIEYLFPSFPHLAGTVSGTARLDSLWLDVRFSKADVTHHDGDADPSHITGSGRITDAEPFLVFDVDLAATPLSFTTLARSYPELALRGSFSGPLRVKGTMENMDLATVLTGGAGTLAVDGHFDLYPPGFAARGTGSLTNVNLRTLLGRADVPVTRLTASAAGDVRGDSLAALSGTLALGVERSYVDTLRIYPSAAHLSFGRGRLTIDTLHAETIAATLSAAGSIGLEAGVTDSLRYTLFVDSLGGLRRWLAPVSPPRAPSAVASVMTAGTDGAAQGSALGALYGGDTSNAAVRDSLAGTIEARGVLAGSVRDFRTHGSLVGTDIFYFGDRAARMSGDYAFAGLPDGLRGSATLRLDSAVVAGLRLTSLGGHVVMTNASSGTASLRADATNGVTSSASLAFARDSAATRLSVDSLAFRFPDHAWTLAGPAHVVLDSSGLAVDTLRLQDGLGGSLAFAGVIPAEAPIDAHLTIDSLPFADLGVLGQFKSPMAGDMHLDLALTGTRALPVMRITAAAHGAKVGQIGFPDIAATAHYASRRFDTQLQFLRADKPVLAFTGSLPVDLALTEVATRLPDEPLRGELRADSLDLNIAEVVSPAFRGVKGRGSMDVLLGGSWQRPLLSGRIGIRNGEVYVTPAGVQLKRLTADITLERDTIRFNRLSAQSGELREDTVALTGFLRIPDYRRWDQSMYFANTLTMHHFQAIAKRRVADLEVSGQLRLQGPITGAQLSGGLTIDRGTIYVPDQVQKQIVNLNESDIYSLIDTSAVSVQQIVPQVPTLVRNIRLEHVQVGVGEDVWLRSAEANIRLAGGPLEVTRGDSSFGLSGTLQANRGTYRLDLGLVQRTFTVDEGTVQFFGDPAIPAEVHISASYTVRQVTRQDVHIRATLAGTLTNLKLDLTSDERIPLSKTDILSYLIVGAPSFALGGQNSVVIQQAAAVLLPSIGSVLEQTLSDQLRLFDTFQIQTANVSEASMDPSAGALSGLLSSSLFSGTTLSFGRQIGDKTFVTFSSVVCGGSSANTQSVRLNYGLTVERRLDHGFWIQAGIDPGSAPCTQNADITYQRQKGFDLFREWRF